MSAAAAMIAVITRETRLGGLKARWATTGAAAFRLHRAASHELELRRRRRIKVGLAVPRSQEAQFEQAAEALADHEMYEHEDRAYRTAVARLLDVLDVEYPVRTIDRAFVPNFDFGRCVAVVVIGPDGLVANAAKYVGDLPIVGVNPDPDNYDGILLPFRVPQARAALLQAIAGSARTREVTLAELNTNDGQRLLAFNDFFVGSNSHVSARYTLETTDRHESQSSSGVLISTGAGSTGWLSSMFNMTDGFARFFGGSNVPRMKLAWEDRQLVWAVREPFRSRHSAADLVVGTLLDGEELVIGSQMPTGGVVFSDGVEADFVEFNSGTIARFTVSSQRARLVVP